MTVMKTNQLFIILGCLCISIVLSCNKDKVDDIEIEKVNEIDQFIGTYVGIEIYTVFDSLEYVSDTSDLIITLSKTSEESTVNINYSTNGRSDLFTFENGKFHYVGSPYHSPTLYIPNDTLFYHHQPGLGPLWYDRIAIKE